MKFLKHFSKNNEGMYIIFDLYSFDNFFKLLLNNNLENSEVLDYMVANCSLSGLVFQERIFNKKYLKFLPNKSIDIKKAAIKARLIHDIYYS